VNRHLTINTINNILLATEETSRKIENARRNLESLTARHMNNDTPRESLLPHSYSNPITPSKRHSTKPNQPTISPTRNEVTKLDRTGKYVLKLPPASRDNDIKLNQTSRNNEEYEDEDIVEQQHSTGDDQTSNHDNGNTEENEETALTKTTEAWIPLMVEGRKKMMKTAMTQTNRRMKIDSLN
jgi:hypothetical protein